MALKPDQKLWCPLTDAYYKLTPKQKKYVREGANQVTEGWQCPNCGGAHAPDVKTCPHGGLDQQQQWKCGNCGQYILGSHTCHSPAGCSIDWDARARYWLT